MVNFAKIVTSGELVISNACCTFFNKFRKVEMLDSEYSTDYPFVAVWSVKEEMNRAFFV